MKPIKLNLGNPGRIYNKISVDLYHRLCINLYNNTNNTLSDILYTKIWIQCRELSIRLEVNTLNEN